MLANKIALCYNSSMERLYDEVRKIIDGIDFESIWPSFAPCQFALYNKAAVYLDGKEMPWDTRFVGNTAIMLDDIPTAIWHIENSNDVDMQRLAACLVHEMFHAFQHSQGESRYPDEFAILTYPQDLDNYRLKMAENHYLAKACMENSMVDLQQFVVLREARRRIIGEAIEQELCVETIEGLAEYAGLMALNQISHAKFMDEIEGHLRALRNPENICNVRLGAYSTGCVICFTLKSLGIDSSHKMSDDRMIYDFIPRKQSEIDTYFDELCEQRQNRLDDFLRSPRKRIEHTGEITGFDPMSMDRLGDRILCYNFVKLGDLCIEGPVMLEMAEGSLRGVVAYIK